MGQFWAGILGPPYPNEGLRGEAGVPFEKNSHMLFRHPISKMGSFAFQILTVAEI